LALWGLSYPPAPFSAPLRKHDKTAQFESSEETNPQLLLDRVAL
jgi:hypothetical protein